MRMRKKKISPPPKKLDPQQRTSEFITVGWMLTTLSTLAAEVVGLLAAIPLYWSDTEWPALLRALPGLMLLVACLSGTVGLILCAIATSRKRDTCHDGFPPKKDSCEKINPLLVRKDPL